MKKSGYDTPEQLMNIFFCKMLDNVRKAGKEPILWCELDPGYGLAHDEQSHIIGIMGTMWGEAIRDINRVTYMAFPRALALAEAGWTDMQHRSWEGLKNDYFQTSTAL